MEGVLPGERRPITLTNLPEGLVGTLGVRVEDSSNVVVVARTTAGTEEFAKGSYRVWITFPTTKGFVVVIADGPEGVEAIEEFRVTVDPVAVTPGPENYVPTVQDVANFIPARTKNEYGKQAGTFTAETNPTEQEVIQKIPSAVRRIASHIGIQIVIEGDAETQQSLIDEARELVALLVALRIERGYKPEQVGSDRSPYKEMLDDYKEGLETLIESVSEHTGGGGGESVGGVGPLPAASFPCPSGIGSQVW